MDGSIEKRLNQLFEAKPLIKRSEETTLILYLVT